MVTTLNKTCGESDTDCKKLHSDQSRDSTCHKQHFQNQRRQVSVQILLGTSRLTQADLGMPVLSPEVVNLFSCHQTTASIVL